MKNDGVRYCKNREIRTLNDPLHYRTTLASAKQHNSSLM